MRVFDSVSTDLRALLFALLDQADARADVAGLLRDLNAAAGNPRKQLRRLVSFTCRFYTQAADIIDIARGAGSTNEDLLAMWQEGEEQRLLGQKPLAMRGIVLEHFANASTRRKPWISSGP